MDYESKKLAFLQGPKVRKANIQVRKQVDIKDIK